MDVDRNVLTRGTLVEVRPHSRELPVDLRYRSNPLRSSLFMLERDALMSKPMCRHARFSRACWQYWNNTQEFLAWRGRIDADRAKRRLAHQKHEKCPNTPGNPTPDVILAFRELDLQQTDKDAAFNLATCPVACRATMAWQTTPQASVLVDMNNPGEPPRFGQLHAFVETEETRVNDAQRLSALGRTDLLASFTPLSDVWLTYAFELRAHEDPLCGAPREFPYLTTYVKRCLPPPPTRKELETDALGFVALFISNCNAEPRTSYTTALLAELNRQLRLANRTRRIQSFGKCFRTPSDDDDAGGSYSATSARLKIKALQRFKFYLSFENHHRNFLATDKIFHGVLGRAVPVVWGSPEIVDVFLPGKGYGISTFDFESPEALARRLVELDTDHDAYLEHFRWHSDPTRLNYDWPQLDAFDFTAKGHESLVCRLCVVYSREYCFE